VPDNVLTPLLKGVTSDNDFMPVAATREDEAIAAVAGAYRRSHGGPAQRGAGPRPAPARSDPDPQPFHEGARHRPRRRPRHPKHWLKVWPSTRHRVAGGISVFARPAINTLFTLIMRKQTRATTQHTGNDHGRLARTPSRFKSGSNARDI